MVARRIAWGMVVGFMAVCCLFEHVRADQEPVVGPEYQGPKAVVAVGDFGVLVRGAPEEIGDGLREMLTTALFESNRFKVVDRLDPAGISSEQLLSDSFMADADAILNQGKMLPAELLISGAVTALDGRGLGLRLKIPCTPVKVGGKYHKARVSIDLRVVDSASGRVVSALSVDGSALSGRAMVGTSATETALPLSLTMVKNTPLELAIRDCIYRSVIELVKSMPDSFFRY